jgi:hypothetical protein
VQTTTVRLLLRNYNQLLTIFILLHDTEATIVGRKSLKRGLVLAWSGEKAALTFDV